MRTRSRRRQCLIPIDLEINKHTMRRKFPPTQGQLEEMALRSTINQGDVQRRSASRPPLPAHPQSDYGDAFDEQQIPHRAMNFEEEGQHMD